MCRYDVNIRIIIHNYMPSFINQQLALTITNELIQITLTNDLIIDIDECSIGSHNCGPAFTCHNVPGSFRCEYKICPRNQRLNITTGECLGAQKCSKGYVWTEYTRRCEGQLIVICQQFIHLQAILNTRELSSLF